MVKSKLSIQQASRREIAASSFVGFASFLFCFYIFPAKFLLPWNYMWIFGDRANIRDDAGHAIASLFFSTESWKWPLGAMSSLGGEVSGSIMYFATSPIFAVPFKILDSIGLFANGYQFIGMQVLSGIVLTNVTFYFLCRKIGASVYSSIVVSLASILLAEPMIRWTNESLASQYIVILSMIMVLTSRISLTRSYIWFSLTVFAVGTNQYFTPIVILMSLIEALYLTKHSTGSMFLKLRSLLFTMVAMVGGTYLWGGFVLNTLKLNTGIADLSQFSSNIFSYFDSRGMGITPNLSSQPSWESYNYIGIVATILLIGSLLIFLTRFVQHYIFSNSKTKIRINFDSKNTFWWLTLACAISFLISLGPVIQIGPSLKLTIDFPDKILEVLSTFRALARFSWPGMYLLLSLSALVIDKLMLIVKRKNFQMPSQVLVAVLLVGLQFNESSLLIHTMREVVKKDSNVSPRIDVKIQREFQTANGIIVIPPFDGDADGIPWRQISFYTLDAKLALPTWGFFARYDFVKAGEIQAAEVGKFNSCIWSPNTIYLVRKELLEKAKCKSEYAILEEYLPTWVLIKSK